MVINSLGLKNFRNYTDFQVKFCPGINFLYGNNGQGKTNLIESLYFLTHLKSFRTSKTRDLCAFGKKTSIIHTNLSKQDVLHEIRIDLHENQKKVSLDQKKITFASEYIRFFFSLLFAPDQLTAFKEYPMERRNFIDRILFTVDDKYFKRIKEFNRIKKQKGYLLRTGNSKDVFIWNQLISRTIPKIIEARKALTEKINEFISDVFSSLTGRTERLQFLYRNDFEGKSGTTQSEILDFLSGKLDVEISKGFVCYGPHKDNFWMTLDGKLDKKTFSQGEYRISFLALQLAVNKIVSEKLKFNPVVLLDDIFSELDECVYRRTIEYIHQRQNQVFITSTKIPKLFSDFGKTFHVTEGRLSI